MKQNPVMDIKRKVHRTFRSVERLTLGALAPSDKQG